MTTNKEKTKEKEIKIPEGPKPDYRLEHFSSKKEKPKKKEGS